MNITSITGKAGAHRNRKRVGRGRASGHGKTCGRGHKGAGARTGTTTMGLREGGQTPLFRRLPKRGFSNARFTTRYSVVNVSDLERKFESGQTVNGQSLAAAGLVRDAARLVKVLGDGAISKSLVVEVDKVSRQAQAKIQAAGGEVRLVQR